MSQVRGTERRYPRGPALPRIPGEVAARAWREPGWQADSISDPLRNEHRVGRVKTELELPGDI